jgi:hypothetical protein
MVIKISYQLIKTKYFIVWVNFSCFTSKEKKAKQK